MEYTGEDFKNCMIKICGRLMEIRDELTEIDAKLGDGDMGVSMGKAAGAVRATVEGASPDMDLKDLLMRSASALNQAAPSTMGTLLSGALFSLAKFVSGKTALNEEDLVMIPTVMVQAISQRGKAQKGDKTILDALIPYADTLKEEYAAALDIESARKKAYRQAVAGMESTKGILAKKGRASWLGERNMEYPDAGAVMFCKVVEIL